MICLTSAQKLKSLSFPLWMPPVSPQVMQVGAGMGSPPGAVVLVAGAQTGGTYTATGTHPLRVLVLHRSWQLMSRDSFTSLAVARIVTQWKH